MISKAAFYAVSIYMALYVLRQQVLTLRYFRPVEFGVWFPLMDRELLIKLDEFRHELGYPVSISPAPGAIGRPTAPTSQHFPNPFVKAVDIMTDAPLSEVYQAARKVGFTGIGLYPDWLPKPGAHLDIRSDRSADNPALWSAVKTADGQNYIDIESALV